MSDQDSASHGLTDEQIDALPVIYHKGYFPDSLVVAHAAADHAARYYEAKILHAAHDEAEAQEARYAPLVIAAKWAVPYSKGKTKAQLQAALSALKEGN